MTDKAPKGVSGYAVADKPEGMTSYRFLERCADLVGPGVKAGHAGTLDSFASGVLICLFGSYTRLSDWFMGSGKTYEADILFGEETDTLDPEGRVVATAPLPSREALEAALPAFRGRIMQAPPAYSSVHVDGMRARERAVLGQDVHPAARPVEILSLQLNSYDGAVAKVTVECSKGTYIRSLARDIALACGSRGRLSALRRTRSGPFSADQGLPLEGFGPGAPRYLGKAEALGLGLAIIDLEEREAAAFVNGLPLYRLPAFDPEASEGPRAVFGADGCLLGVAVKRGQAWRYACVTGGRD